MRKVKFHIGAFEEYNQWAIDDIKTFERIKKLIVETLKSPFTGIGKPEPLKGDLKGYWSRRIDREHRLIYKVDEEDVTILACKYHYE